MRALTHRSAAPATDNYEALEFLGDRVLGPGDCRGTLIATRRRQASAIAEPGFNKLVCAETLAEVARELGIARSCAPMPRDSRRRQDERQDARRRLRGADCRHLSRWRPRSRTCLHSRALAGAADGVRGTAARMPRPPCRNGPRRARWATPGLPRSGRVGPAHGRVFRSRSRLPACHPAQGQRQLQAAGRATRGRSAAAARRSLARWSVNRVAALSPSSVRPMPASRRCSMLSPAPRFRSSRARCRQRAPGCAAIVIEGIDPDHLRRYAGNLRAAAQAR